MSSSTKIDNRKKDILTRSLPKSFLETRSVMHLSKHILRIQ